MPLHSQFETARSFATCQRMFDPLNIRRFIPLEIRSGSRSKQTVSVLVKTGKDHPETGFLQRLQIHLLNSKITAMQAGTPSNVGLCRVQKYEFSFYSLIPRMLKEEMAFTNLTKR